MVDWVVKVHPDFLRDLDRLDNAILQIFRKKKEKIRLNPLRLKHLSGGENCYREEITRNIRLIYYIKSNVIWFLTIGPHDKAYEDYIKRLHNLRQTLIK